MWKLSEIVITLSVSYNGGVASALIWRRQQLLCLTQLATVSSRRGERDSCDRRNVMLGHTNCLLKHANNYSRLRLIGSLGQEQNHQNSINSLRLIGSKYSGTKVTQLCGVHCISQAELGIVFARAHKQT